ncbi:hypothetical protein GS399_07500 [Pedobacter sp. HMF7647]|uniref:DUF4175 family protein n=1 Tax=Hufsiella arboris TaxID=2695275 RepID=A0A7K1Y8A4_9SPHI|nr:DUF4175 domain-containing protein [Hufsiella arboris]MXV50815.1 hypothetical protein [Hufsiella arboris]
MTHSTNDIIQNWKTAWRFKNLLTGVLLCGAVSFAIFIILRRFISVPSAAFFVVFISGFASYIFTYPFWKINNRFITSYLDVNFPKLEESTALLQKQKEDMSLLERLQFQKVYSEIDQINRPAKFYLPERSVLIISSIAIVLGLILLKTATLRSTPGSPMIQHQSNQKKETILPEIESNYVVVTPPSYTGKSLSKQSEFSLQILSGSVVRWTVKTNEEVKKVAFLFNTGKVSNLRKTLAGEWTFTEKFTRTGFYQLSINGKLSDFYQIEVVQDNAPFIKVIKPKPYSMIDFGQPEKVATQITISDDYGISNAYISATIASGSGEAVKFKEQQLSFNTGFSASGKSYDLLKIIDLKSLGMVPGDELYFYVKAVDNHQQESRSDVMIISIADTARLMSMDGMVTSLDVKPELFRSQRQIIIETEQLLRSKDTISAADFKKKSNDLGIDQQLLRLRYGKFLGEENENSIGEHDHGDEHHEDGANEIGNAGAIMDAYAHKHDQAEDATFFEPETKKQLKETLTQMWNSELRLRTFKPAEALPYEYKALRLLKDLQQKSRVYVAKTSTKLPPLKPAEKRLTGDLSKITDPIIKNQITESGSLTAMVRKASEALQRLQQKKALPKQAYASLREFNVLLTEKAGTQPSVYLPAVASLRRIIGFAGQPYKISSVDFIIAEQALQKALSPAASIPQRDADKADVSLSKEYYKSLSRMNP